MPDLVRI